LLFQLDLLQEINQGTTTRLGIRLLTVVEISSCNDEVFHAQLVVGPAEHTLLDWSVGDKTKHADLWQGASHVETNKYDAYGIAAVVPRAAARFGELDPGLVNPFVGSNRNRILRLYQPGVEISKDKAHTNEIPPPRMSCRRGTSSYRRQVDPQTSSPRGQKEQEVR